MERNKLFYVLPLLMILLLSSASALEIVVGKVYEGDYNTPAPDVPITVTCGSVSLATESLSDGVYGVKFDEAGCDGTSSISVSASKGYYSGDETGSMMSIGTDYLSIVNVLMDYNAPDSPSRRGGGRRRDEDIPFFLCGNGICESGEFVSTCPADCDLTLQNLNAEDENEDLEPIVDLTGTDSQGFISRLTGAVIGGGNTGTKFAFGFIALLLVMAIAVFVIRTRKRVPVEPVA